MTLKSYLKSCGLGSQLFVAHSLQGRTLFLSEESGDILAYAPAKCTPETFTQEWMYEVLTWTVKEDPNGHMCVQPTNMDVQSFDID